MRDINCCGVAVRQSTSSSDTAVIFGVKNFNEQAGGANIIPLRMNAKIIDGIGEFKFAIYAFKERRLYIFRCDIESSPVIIWFNSMHSAKLGLLLTISKKI